MRMANYPVYLSRGYVAGDEPPARSLIPYLATEFDSDPGFLRFLQGHTTKQLCVNDRLFTVLSLRSSFTLGHGRLIKEGRAALSSLSTLQLDIFIQHVRSERRSM